MAHCSYAGQRWLAAALVAVCSFNALAAEPGTKPRIAVFSGPTATIQNNKPLITSNKAREQYGLPLRKDAWGHPLMDWPRHQRLAASAIMKLGPLPHAADPQHPTSAERDAIKKKIELYQAIFQTH